MANMRNSKSRMLTVFLTIGILSVCPGTGATSPANEAEKIRQGVITSLPEASSIQDKELRERVYDAWVEFLVIKGKKELEDIPVSLKPGSPVLKDKNLADQLRSSCRLAIAYAKDFDKHLPLWDVDFDRVVACVLCYSLGDAVVERVLQTSWEVVSESGVGETARYAHENFWVIAEHAGLLTGAENPPTPEADNEFVMWEKHRMKVDKEVRDGVIESFPEARQIKNHVLRERFYDAWAYSLMKSSFDRVEDLRGSGAPTSEALIGGTQTDHVRGVGRIALIIAKEFSENFGVKVNMDEVLVGGLLHDVGKPHEFDPVNRAKWSEDTRLTGFPPMRHSVYGAYICLAVGLPEKVAHIPGAHSREGVFIERTTACEMVREADHMYWGITNKAGILEEYQGE